jgi:Tol biopolymer transport system component
VWSPTGEQIVFVTSSHGMSWDALRILDVATGSVTLLTDDVRGVPSVIGFSPPGDRILYAIDGGEADASGLWRIGVDGSDNRVLVAGTREGEWLLR